MDKKYHISGYFIFVFIMCVCLFFVAQFLEITESKEIVSTLENEIAELEGELAASLLLFEEKDSEAVNTGIMYLELEDSYTALSAEHEEGLNTISQMELLIARQELLNEDEGNRYLESEVFDKVVYLTFDDGPSQRTVRIIELLEKYGIKATFFVNYHPEAEEAGLYKMIVDSGHAIGNHTYDHAYADEDWDVFLESLFKMEDFIFEQTGVRTKIMRFPGGSHDSWKYNDELIHNIELLCDMGYIYFDWNLTNHDADTRIGAVDEERMYELVTLESGGREMIMILMHDSAGKYVTVNALEDIIVYYMERGYVFLPVTQYSYNPQHFSLTDDVYAGEYGD